MKARVNVHGPAGAVGESSPGGAAQGCGVRNESGAGRPGGRGKRKKRELVRAKGREKVQRGESLKEEEGKEVRAAEGAGPFSTGTSGMRAPPARMRRDNPR